MGEDRREPDPLDPAALMARAQAGGPGAALAAKRAALVAERRGDPALALKALALAAKLEPLDPQPRLASARLKAEAGDFEAARTEASAVLADAVDQAARARAAFMLGELARAERSPDRARGFFEQALEIEDSILAANRSDPTAARWYARARGRLAELDAAAGERARALAGAEGALALLRAAAAQTGETPVLAADIADAELRLGAFELDDHRPASARRRLGEAIARYEAIAVTERDEPHWREVLSDAWALAAEADLARGAADPAREAMDKAVQARIGVASNHPEEAWALAGTWRLRGALRAALGDASEASQSLAQARALAERLVAQAPDAESPARFLVHTLIEQADHALRTNAIAAAREAADAARMRAETFARAPDAEAAWLSECAACWDRLGEVARSSKAGAQAQDAFARAVEFRRLARERNGRDPRTTRGLAAALLKLGDEALTAGADATARASFSESVSLRLHLVDANPDDARAALALAAALERFGLAALACGDRMAARGAWEDELALAERIFTRDDLEGVRFRAIVESHLAGLGGPDGEDRRAAALMRFDTLARAGVLTEREAALRRRLWNGG
jgi:tetratricopeptide (TPR) repeat protein